MGTFVGALVGTRKGTIEETFKGTLAGTLKRTFVATCKGSLNYRVVLSPSTRHGNALLGAMLAGTAVDATGPQQTSRGG